MELVRIPADEVGKTPETRRSWIAGVESYSGHHPRGHRDSLIVLLVNQKENRKDAFDLEKFSEVSWWDKILDRNVGLYCLLNR